MLQLKFIEEIKNPTTAQLLSELEFIVDTYNGYFKSDFYYDVKNIMILSQEQNKRSHGITNDYMRKPFIWLCREHGTNFLTETTHGSPISSYNDLVFCEEFLVFSDIQCVVFYNGNTMYYCDNKEEIEQTRQSLNNEYIL